MDHVTIANSALVKLGADTISAIGEDSRSGKLMQAVYDRIRDEVLRAHNWAFAMKRAILVPTSTAPSFEYDFSYTIPSDCLRPYAIYPTDVEYIIEGSEMLSNDSSLSIKYIYRNTDASMYESSFAEALAWRLAGELAYALTNSTEREQACMKSYKDTIAEARFFNSAQQTIKVLESDIWLNARR